MKRFMLGSALALACSVGLAAQTATVKSETKVDVKDGKDVTVTGCLARSASGTAFLLNNVEGKDVASKAYILVGDDLDGHIGHFIEVKGKAIRFAHEMKNDGTGGVAATTVLVAVHLDAATRKARALPDDVRDRERALIEA